MNDECQRACKLWQCGESYRELLIRHILILGSVAPLFAIVVPTASHNNEVVIASISIMLQL